MTDPVIYTFTVGDYENPIFLRGDDLLDELEVCNILNEHTALLAMRDALKVIDIALTKRRAYAHIGRLVADTLAALPEGLK